MKATAFLLFIPTVFADILVSVDPAASQAFKGFGTSLCWWANVVNDQTRDFYADLFFSLNETTLPNQSKLPGLGLNIVRYNIGGTGRQGDVSGLQEQQSPANPPAYKMIEGYWKNWYSRDPQSDSWDWYRDANQRNMLWAAQKRGVQFIEFFSNAPMWWMTEEKSSAGGKLQSWNYQDFSYYVASVVKYAQQNWGLSVFSVDMFNEPSAGWWTFGKTGQEGVNLDRDSQYRLINSLNSQLATLGIPSVNVAAADENSVSDAINTFSVVSPNEQSRLSANASVAPYQKINVHGYYGLEPFRDTGKMDQLRQIAGSNPIWVSEYGDADATGEQLAITIMQNLKHLTPEAWVYWQVLEPESGWGLVLGNYSNNALVYQTNNKYFVYAHFTRYIRPGDLILKTDYDYSIVSVGNDSVKVTAFSVNGDQTININLDGLNVGGSKAHGMSTSFNGASVWQEFKVNYTSNVLSIRAVNATMYSLELFK